MIKTVNNSNLPMSIRKDNKIFARSGKCAKFATGPTVPIPGPTLPKQVATAPTDETKSNPKMERSIEPKTNIKI